MTLLMNQQFHPDVEEQNIKSGVQDMVSCKTPGNLV